ncbi:uncharacterized protein LOC143876821 isoform X2 [Tasmannia lanceolata]|uniref:uncharacterized protein LOC143876821 isoform X2 n=1 Tax=Tasmannia lanceolata TaxID=3420 RepID=UPI00406291F8
MGINGGDQTVVGVKQVEQGMPEEEWDESMPLPGDIIEGVGEEDDEELFVAARGRSEFTSQLRRINRHLEETWAKVRRGDATLKLRVCVVLLGCCKIQRWFTIRAASDHRHVLVLGDLTLQQCAELQQMGRRVVHLEGNYNRMGVKYDWKKKVGTYLPDRRATVINSILFTPLPSEDIHATISRSMAWFSAAVSSGTSLIFVNIQTEQILISERTSSSRGNGQIIWPECWGRDQSATIQSLQGIRLWFLPGLAEIPLKLSPEPGETLFGMNIQRTEEGFICVYSVEKGLAGDRAGLRQMCDRANQSGKLVVISRVEGKSLMPSTVSATGVIHCYDYADVQDTFTSAVDHIDGIHLHVMAWPTEKAPHPHPPQAMGPAALIPPSRFKHHTSHLP